MTLRPCTFFKDVIEIAHPTIGIHTPYSKLSFDIRFLPLYFDLEGVFLEFLAGNFACCIHYLIIYDLFPTRAS